MPAGCTVNAGAGDEDCDKSCALLDAFYQGIGPAGDSFGLVAEAPLYPFLWLKSAKNFVVDKDKTSVTFLNWCEFFSLLCFFFGVEAKECGYCAMEVSK